MSGLTGSNYPLCVCMCVSFWQPLQRLMITQLCLIPLIRGVIIMEQNNLLLSHIFPMILWNLPQISAVEFFMILHLRSAFLESGMEQWGDRRWGPDVTNSWCRSTQHSHNHSAHQNRPPVSLCLRALPGNSERVTLARGVAFHCLLLTCVRPRPHVRARLCVRRACVTEPSFVRFCRTEKWNQGSLRDSHPFLSTRRKLYWLKALCVK